VKCTRTRVGGPDAAQLARVGLERRPRYVLRPTRATCLVWHCPRKHAIPQQACRTTIRPVKLSALAAATAGLLALAIGLIFFYAPTDLDQGFSQRIFYFHVPIALTSYVCFGWGAWKALRYLRTRDERADLESYVAIHQGVIFGALTLITGSIWAKASWGVWWSWGENQLVLFLVLFLFYCAYFMLRFSVEPGAARANMSAVYALFGIVLVPVSFLAIRLSQSFIHPTVFTTHGPQMAGSQFLTFSVSLAALLALFATLYQVELAGKRIDAHLRELRELLA
jgi:heme exporter protein C